jgi:predicted RNA-binding protein with PIN domain
VHWLVDGLNVIGSRPDGWWRDRPGAMRRLLDLGSAYAQRTGDELTIVFDGSPLRPPVEPGPGVTAVFAPGPGPNAADAEIVRVVERLGRPTVVTSDRDLAQRVAALGAPVEPASAFRRRLEKAQEGGTT